MKKYLLIGAGPGNGFATASRFAKAGFHIVLASRSGRKIASQVAELRQSGATVDIETLDATDAKSVVSIVERHGSDLAVMHFNVGILHYDANGALQTRSLDDETVESLADEMQADVVSALAAVKTAAALMTPRNSGTILITGGGFGVEPTPAFLTISVAKAGVRAATKALFDPLKKKGIHIATVTVATLVEPGSEKAAEVANAFWDLHAQEQDQWEWEKVIK
jgi:NAD(P)-dependent dehydrogenase (short-subunit alcohol dehydrogenase family)